MIQNWAQAILSKKLADLTAGGDVLEVFLQHHSFTVRTYEVYFKTSNLEQRMCDTKHVNKHSQKTTMYNFWMF